MRVEYCLHRYAKRKDRRKVFNDTRVKLRGVGVVALVVENICQEIFIRRARRLGEACAEILEWAEKRVGGFEFVNAASYSHRIVTWMIVVNFPRGIGGIIGFVVF